MSEAVHTQAAAAQAQREEQREEKAAHTQRENMAAQREPQRDAQRETQQRDAQQRDAQQRDAQQRDAQQRDVQQRDPQQRDPQQQRETPRETQQRETVPQQRASSRFEDEWQAVQFEFVDDPQAAVSKADDLVTKAIEELTTRQRTLSQQWKGEGKHETEDLRLALHRYRELFKSLVAVK
jgi:hypothetical protein